MAQVAFELNDELSAQEQLSLQQVLPGLAQSVVELQRRRDQDNYERLVQLFLGDATPRSLDVQRARLQAEARRAVFEGSEWLTVNEWAANAGLGANPHATINRWKQARRVFAIRRAGRDYFPRYALDEDFRLLAAMGGVLQVLTGYSDEGLATWFESTSSFLGGRRPRELLGTEPERVIAAARNAVEAEEFLG
ncbi:hypothetical protein GCM10028796_33230 [Ramlibacter monticola]|uniref:DUF2384 domain-containing protein n=1 Tax=Ramlibacter monticola TaxID=1926872 RepID=A0A936Z350_9BURK|nr:hypothetical protein [Ramlibacter monticola]MBL0394104.1 hypothetical protein [Ramlibacter monticola]